jgi:adenosylmethionine-8-amino-7-oxononanoate aminotransferase
MSDTKSKDLPRYVKPEGKWSNTFSNHPFDIELERAEGIYLYDTNGQQYIDASGGPMAVNIPHNDPRMKQAITQQLDEFNFVHPILASRPRATLYDNIADVAPGSLNASYLVSGGSEAVDTALKLVRQAQIAMGHNRKYKVLSNHESYHEMTIAALAVSGNASSQTPFEPMLTRYPQINQYSDHLKPIGMSQEEWGVISAQELAKCIHYAGQKTVAAYLATPHGAGCDYGVVPPRAYWQEIRSICDHYDVLLIADEVVTGFGRTGKWFGMQHFNVQADAMTTAKGISGMYAPLGAVTVSDEINDLFKSDNYFIHGFTGGGHPVSVAAGIATINIMTQDRLVDNAAAMESVLFAHKDRLLSHSTVKDVRGWGRFLVGELVKNKDTMEFFDQDQRAEMLFQQLGLKNGLALFGTLYGARRQPAVRRGLPFWIAPPLCINEDQVNSMMERLDYTLTEWERSLGV